MTLLFFDFEFNLLHAEPKVIKSSSSIYYNGVGSFEAHIPLESEATKIVMDNKYLVVVQNGFSAIVVGKELRNELIIYARTCNWLLSKRITPEFEAVSGNAGLLASGFVSSAFSDVSNFVTGEIATSGVIEYQSGQGTTLDVVTDCLKEDGAGHNLVFDYKNKRWIFNVIKGKENDVIFSEANKNAYDTRLSLDIIDLATCGRYDMESDNGFVSTFLEGDADKKGIYRWEAELSGKNHNEAMVSLKKKTERSETTLCTKDAKFGRDYSLGDVVRVQIIKGAYRATVRKKIIGVEMRTENGMSDEQPVFEDV